MGVPRTQNSLLGKGLSFPLRMDPATNDFARVVDEDNVDQCLKALIFTMIGERMDALIGTVVPELLFEESDVAADIAQPSILNAITRNEPRVKLIRIQVTTKEFGGGATGIVIAISYIIKATNQRRNRVYPYALPDGSK